MDDGCSLADMMLLVVFAGIGWMLWRKRSSKVVLPPQLREKVQGNVTPAKIAC